MSVSYRLSLAAHARHLVDVELHVRQPSSLGSSIEVFMAAWSPGSYLIRDYARYVRDVRAFAHDTEVPVTKLDKQRWRIECGDGCEALRVSYQVYGHDLTVRTNHFDRSHAFVHAPATFLMLEETRDEPCVVTVELPAPDWIVATGLEPESLPESLDEPGVCTFRASGIDQLLDSPIHASDPDVTHERTMDVLGTDVRLVIWGPIAGSAFASLDRLVTDLAAIMARHAQRFDGRIPCDRYTFILMLTPGGYGGLEHRNSSANLHDPHCLETRDNYRGLLELLSHEFFHVWNGKRIFPQALSRFDYTREGYTRCLWVMEGLTSYYDRYTVLRASDMDIKYYLRRLAEEWGQYQSVVGRHLHSLEEASFDAWIKLYKPDESNINTTVSYYLAGGLTALVLDLEIRARTDGERSLADVLRALWDEYGRSGTPYPEDVQPIFERATGLDLGGFFAAVIRGREEPDLVAALARVGLTLEPDQNGGEGAGAGGDSPDDSRGRPRVWLGVALGQNDGRVNHVLDGSPGARAGLSPGDRIIALDGWQVNGKGAVDKRLRTMEPGREIEIALFRRKRLTRVNATLEAAPPRRYRIMAREGDETQRALFAAWLGEDHPGPGKLATAGKGPRWS